MGGESIGSDVDVSCGEDKLSLPSEANFTAPHWRAIPSLFLCRLVLPGLIILPILQLFVSSGWISPTERLLQFVVVIEAVAPPAQTIMVSLNELGLVDIAPPMAYLYIFQYLFSVLTFTMWTTLALRAIY